VDQVADIFRAAASGWELATVEFSKDETFAYEWFFDVVEVQAVYCFRFVDLKMS
jgi:hypothetical protein